MLIGWIAALWFFFRAKQVKTVLLSAFIPFYVLYSVLKMEETLTKKVLAIMLHGAFLIFTLTSILKLIMTPPQ